MRFYNKAGFRIKSIFCDGEFKAMIGKVSDDLDVQMNNANAQDHVLRQKRTIGQLKKE